MVASFKCYWRWIGGGCVTLGAAYGLWGVATEIPPSTRSEDASAQLSESDVSVHLFEWTWNDIAEECESFLGPQGYHSVQISPPQEHIVAVEQGYPWWQRYQPVSYRLVSRSGDRDQLRTMVQRCGRAGVAVYADAVINHMAAIDLAPGFAGTKYSKYDYPGLYSADDFNACRQPITNYQDADQVTQCELVSLPDLNTASPKVQAHLVDYLVDLLDVGIAGYRIDAAKHIRHQDLAEILAQLRHRVDPDPYVYQEVIDPGTEAIKKQEYYALGDVIEFEYGRLVGEAFLNQGDRTLDNLYRFEAEANLVPSEQAVVFIDNHDKQRGHGGGGTYLTYKDGRLHTLALVFMMAYPYGKPRVMSSYAFSDSEQGPPAETDGRTKTVYGPDELGCGEAWICEHRQSEIAAMVDFRNATQAVFEVTDWWSNGGNQIAFGRGDRGFVVINREAAPLTQTFQTQLPAGDYCDVLHASSDDSARCDRIITVNEWGQFQATVEAMGAIALHQGANTSSAK